MRENSWYRGNPQLEYQLYKNKIVGTGRDSMHLQFFDITKSPPKIQQLEQFRKQLELGVRRKKMLGGAVLSSIALIGFGLGVFLIIGRDSVVAAVSATFFGTVASVVILVSLAVISKKSNQLRNEIGHLEPVDRQREAQAINWCRSHPELQRYYQAVTVQGRMLTLGEFMIMQDWVEKGAPTQFTA